MITFLNSDFLFFILFLISLISFHPYVFLFFFLFFLLLFLLYTLSLSLSLPPALSFLSFSPSFKNVPALSSSHSFFFFSSSHPLLSCSMGVSSFEPAIYFINCSILYCIHLFFLAALIFSFLFSPALTLWVFFFL